MEPKRSFLLAKEAAKELGVSKTRICKLCADGKLAAIQPGKEWLISAEAVMERKKLKTAGALPRGGRPVTSTKPQQKTGCQDKRGLVYQWQEGNVDDRN